MDRLIDWLFEKLGKLPTTNARIAATILLVIATGVMYFSTAFVPSYEWLAFLALMSGLDVAAFHSKRRTTYKPTELARAEVIRNGNDIDIDEIIDEIEEDATTDNPELRDERANESEIG